MLTVSAVRIASAGEELGHRVVGPRGNIGVVILDLVVVSGDEPGERRVRRLQVGIGLVLGEPHAGMPDRSHTRKQPATKATLPVVNEIRKLQQNPELGEWRVHAALQQLGSRPSPSTCRRIMARSRTLYGLDKPKRSPKPKKEMPFKASKRHRTVRSTSATSGGTASTTTSPST